MLFELPSVPCNAALKLSWILVLFIHLFWIMHQEPGISPDLWNGLVLITSVVDLVVCVACPNALCTSMFIKVYKTFCSCRIIDLYSNVWFKHCSAILKFILLDISSFVFASGNNMNVFLSITLLLAIYLKYGHRSEYNFQMCMWLHINKFMVTCHILLSNWLLNLYIFFCTVRNTLLSYCL